MATHFSYNYVKQPMFSDLDYSILIVLQSLKSTLVWVMCQFSCCISGSGRVTFSSYKSYVKAVSAAFVEIKTAKFTKKVRLREYTTLFYNCPNEILVYLIGVELSGGE